MMDVMEYLRLYMSAVGSAAAIVVVTFFLFRAKCFRRLSAKRAGYALLIGAIYGALSIWGSASAVSVDVGNGLTALSNVRDLAPLFAGLVGGPVSGIFAGLIGGVFRFFVGGEFTRVACSLITLLAGVVGGSLYYIFKKKPIRPAWGLLIAALTELLHMVFVVLFSVPTDRALDLAAIIAAPMIIVNAAGLFCCLYLYRYIQERENL